MTIRDRSTRRLAVLIATSLVVAACGAGSDESGSPSTTGVGSTSVVTTGTTTGPSTTEPPAASTTTVPAIDCPQIPAAFATRDGLLGGHAAPGVVAVTNGTLIDGTGADPVSDAIVIFEDGLITEVGPATDVAIPEGAAVLDAAGGAILPGLIDTHVHTINAVPIDEDGLDEFAAKLFLTDPMDNGLLTIRDLGSNFGLLAPLSNVREAFDAMGIAVPTLVTAGQLIAHEDSDFITSFANQGVGVGDAADAAEVAIALLDGGADQLKIIIDSKFGVSEMASLDADQISAVTDEAHSRGVRVVAHVSEIDEAWLAMANCADELTHWPGSDQLPDSLIEALVDGGIPVGTTFSIIPPFEGDVRRLLDAGGIVVLSSDAPGTMNPGRIREELNLMLEAGMTPMEVIVASTGDAADAVGVGEHLGTIEPGKIADLLVVAGDPLTDFGALRSVTAVFKRGEQILTGDE